MKSQNLENRLKYLEFTQNINAMHEYIQCKNDLEKMYVE